MFERKQEPETIELTEKKKSIPDDQLNIDYPQLLHNFKILSFKDMNLTLIIKFMPNLGELFTKIENLKTKVKYNQLTLKEYHDEIIKTHQFYSEKYEIMDEEIDSAYQLQKFNSLDYVKIKFALNEILPFIELCKKSYTLKPKELIIEKFDQFNFDHICNEVFRIAQKNNINDVIQNICQIFYNDNKTKEIYLMAILIQGVYILNYLTLDKAPLNSNLNITDKSIIRLSFDCYEILRKMNKDGFEFAAGPIFSILFQITDPFFKIQGIRSKNTYITTETSDYLKKNITPFALKNEEGLILNKIRREQLNDLYQKNNEYINNLIVTLSTIPHDNTMIRLLIARLIAVNYLVTKIKSGQPLKSYQIKVEMDEIFGEEIAELMCQTRSKSCLLSRPSHIDKVINRLNLNDFKNSDSRLFKNEPINTTQNKQEYSEHKTLSLNS